MKSFGLNPPSICESQRLKDSTQPTDEVGWVEPTIYLWITKA